MLKLSVKVFIFIFFLLVVYISFSAMLKLSVNSRFCFKIDSEKKILIFGNSHGSYAVNDSLAGSLVNFCRVGETFYFAEQKIQKLLLANKQIKLICLVLSENQLHHNAYNLVNQDMYMQRSMNSYGFLFPVSTHIDLLKNNPLGYLKSILIADKEYLGLITTNQPLDRVNLRWGGYEHVKDVLSDFNDKPYCDFELASWQPNIKAILRIVDFAQSRGVKVVLTRLPIHESFLKRTKDQYDIKRKEYFSVIPFVDFSGWTLMNDELSDDNHLNAKGAKRFTPIFDSTMNSFVDLQLE